jgi:uncharacterized damage-inducible protein DinB
MPDAYLKFLVDYNAWATARVLDAFETSPELLAATAPGGYGTAGETLNHLLGSEWYYLERLAGKPRADEPSGLDLRDLRSRADELALAAAGLVATLPLPKTLIQRSYGMVAAEAFLGQLVIHGTEHRTQLSAILGSRGLEAPDLSAWRFAGTAS